MTTRAGRPLIDLARPGTPAETWLAWLHGAGLPAPEWGEPRRVVVVAPHPDDETLGTGGSIACWRRQGSDVQVILVTDGEACDPTAGAAARTEMGRRRRHEAHQAAARLGVGAGAVRALGMPDGHVGEHVSRLASSLRPLARVADLVVTTWRHDGHPDHEACGHAAAIAAADTGARLAEVLIWAWHWAEPGASQIPWNQVHAVRLEAADLAAKRAAAAEHQSQVSGPAPPLPITDLDRWLAGVELVIL